MSVATEAQAALRFCMLLLPNSVLKMLADRQAERQGLKGELKSKLKDKLEDKLKGKMKGKMTAKLKGKLKEVLMQLWEASCTPYMSSLIHISAL